MVEHRYDLVEDLALGLAGPGGRRWFFLGEVAVQETTGVCQFFHVSYFLMLFCDFVTAIVGDLYGLKSLVLLFLLVQLFVYSRSLGL